MMKRLLTLFETITTKTSDSVNEYELQDTDTMFERNRLFAEAIAEEIGLEKFEKKIFIDSIIFKFNIRTNSSQELIELALIDSAVNEFHSHGKEITREECQKILESITQRVAL